MSKYFYLCVMLFLIFPVKQGFPKEMMDDNPYVDTCLQSGLNELELGNELEARNWWYKFQKIKLMVLAPKNDPLAEWISEWVDDYDRSQKASFLVKKTFLQESAAIEEIKTRTKVIRNKPSKKIKPKPGSIEKLLGQVQYLESKQQYQEAWEALGIVLRIDPNNGVAQTAKKRLSEFMQ